MLSVVEARTQMLAQVSPGAVETLPIAQAYGRVLALPVIAGRDQPPFASSAMDGYAFQSAATARDFDIVGESAAGRGFVGRLGSDQAVRISTGAPLPDGADGVLIQEDARIDGARLLGAVVDSGRHVRARGIDFKAGACLLQSGRRLDPIAIGLAASTGAAALEVMRRPSVTVFAGGDELAQPGGAAGNDQIYESCSFTVCGLIASWGAEARRAAALPDNEAEISRAGAAALESSDLVVLIGGASVGPHDHARAAFKQLGVEIKVPSISVRPGKPTWFGASKTGLVLGLPGNPASAIVCSHLFLRPILEAMLGRDPLGCIKTELAPLAAPLEANGPRETYLRARLDNGRLSPFEDQDSSLQLVLAQSNALILRAPHTAPATTGEPAPYLRIGDG
jgi:molybdopterin molybdotransferase